MITLIDDTGWPTAVNTTGVHSMKQCKDTLNEFNNNMQAFAGRPYVEAVNQDGDRYMLNISEMKKPIIPRAARAMAENPFLIGTPGILNESFFGTMTMSNI